MEAVTQAGLCPHPVLAGKDSRREDAPGPDRIGHRRVRPPALDPKGEGLPVCLQRANLRQRMFLELRQPDRRREERRKKGASSNLVDATTADRGTIPLRREQIWRKGAPPYSRKIEPGRASRRQWPRCCFVVIMENVKSLRERERISEN